MTQPSPRTSLKGYLLLGLAVLTCPCHLPILLALLAGTGVAGVVGQHVGLVFGALAVVFIASLLLGLRALRPVPVNERREPAPERDEDPMADRSGVWTGDRRH
jgi:mercuric ion transport protein